MPANLAPRQVPSLVDFLSSAVRSRLLLLVSAWIGFVQVVVFAVGAPDAPRDMDKPIRVLVQTDKGDLELDLDAAKAPITTANFLRYVDGKFYDGGRFHRTVKPDNQPDNKVKIEVVQAGINPAREKEEFPPIPLERTNRTGLAHKDGTVSMARDGPDTATS